MINDLCLRFKELYIETEGKILTENLVLEKEPSICIKINDEGKILDKLIAIDENVKKGDSYDWFSVRNIKSKYLSSQKAIGSKMIFSSNNYTLFGRIDTFPLITQEGFVKLFDVKPDQKNKKTTRKSNFFTKYKKNNQIENVFKKNSFLTPSDLIKKFPYLTADDIELLTNDSFITNYALNSYHEKLKSDYNCKESKFFTYNLLINILNNIKNEIKQYSRKQIKLKIFRDKSIKKYQESELNYLRSSLFAIEDQNKIIGGKLGQPFLDNTLNTDKPYMEHRTTKYKIPFPKSKEDVLYIKYLNDYLSLNKGLFYLELKKFSTSKKPFSKEQFIILKKTRYEMFEFIPNYVNEFYKKSFTIKNFLQIKKNKKTMENKKPFTDIWMLEKEIDNIFDKKMTKNYFSDEIKKTNKTFETNLFLIRHVCFLYFRKGQISGKEFYLHAKDIISNMILYHYQHVANEKIKLKISELLNLQLSMREYYEGEKVDIRAELESLKDKISNKNYNDLSQKEFLLLCGQMAYYLAYQSESANKTFRLVEHYLKSRNANVLKSHLRTDFKKYKHKLYLIGENLKFKNAMAILLAYENKNTFTNTDLDTLLIGLISDNILFNGGQ